MLPPEFRPTNLLTLLLGGALVLSFGLNVLLINANAEVWPEDDDNDLTAATAELHFTQRLLTQCQGRQQRQDSLLVTLQAYPAPSVPATSSPAFYSPK